MGYIQFLVCVAVVSLLSENKNNTKRNTVALFAAGRELEVNIEKGRAVAQAVRRWLPTARTGSMWGLLWTKRHWGRFSPSSSVSPANHFTDFSIIIINRG
jgi:hypothetical protein